MNLNPITRKHTYMILHAHTPMYKYISACLFSYFSYILFAFPCKTKQIYQSAGAIENTDCASAEG